MRLRDAMYRRHGRDHTYRSTFYCTETGDYAVVEIPPTGTPEIVQQGRIVKRGSYWFEINSKRQVCDKFKCLGETMTGDLAPEQQADQALKTAVGFRKSLSRFSDACHSAVWDKWADLETFTGVDEIKDT